MGQKNEQMGENYLLHLGPFAGWMWYQDGGRFEKLVRRQLHTYKAMIAFNPLTGLWVLDVGRLTPEGLVLAWLCLPPRNVTASPSEMIQIALAVIDADAALHEAHAEIEARAKATQS